MKTFLNLVATLCIVASFSANANEEYGSYDNDPNKLFDATMNAVDDMKITWKTSKHVAADCNKIRSSNHLAPVASNMVACADWDQFKKVCTIITGQQTTMLAVGHEIRHCFQGAWH